jgi:hypothetical protein
MKILPAGTLSMKCPKKYRSGPQSDVRTDAASVIFTSSIPVFSFGQKTALSGSLNWLKAG